VARLESSLVHNLPSHTAQAATSGSAVAAGRAVLVVARAAGVVLVVVEVAAPLAAVVPGFATAAQAVTGAFVEVERGCTFAAREVVAVVRVAEVVTNCCCRRSRSLRSRHQKQSMGVLAVRSLVVVEDIVDSRLDVGAAVMRAAGKWC
jgi:hypothetical protein